MVFINIVLFWLLCSVVIWLFFNFRFVCSCCLRNFSVLMFLVKIIRWFFVLLVFQVRFFWMVLSSNWYLLNWLVLMLFSVNSNDFSLLIWFWLLWFLWFLRCFRWFVIMLVYVIGLENSVFLRVILNRWFLLDWVCLLLLLWNWFLIRWWYVFFLVLDVRWVSLIILCLGNLLDIWFFMFFLKWWIIRFLLVKLVYLYFFGLVIVVGLSMFIRLVKFLVLLLCGVVESIISVLLCLVSSFVSLLCNELVLCFVMLWVLLMIIIFYQVFFRWWWYLIFCFSVLMEIMVLLK